MRPPPAVRRARTKAVVEGSSFWGVSGCGGGGLGEGGGRYHVFGI